MKAAELPSAAKENGERSKSFVNCAASASSKAKPCFRFDPGDIIEISSGAPGDEACVPNPLVNPSLAVRSTILSKPKPLLCPRPRSENPLPLISFPSSGGNNDPDNEAVTKDPSYTSKLFRRLSTTRELLLRERSVINRGRANTSISLNSLKLPQTRFSPNMEEGIEEEWTKAEKEPSKSTIYRMPKSSYSAKKLAKPYTIVMPPSSAKSPLCFNGRSSMSAYSGRSHFLPVTKSDRFGIREGNSPSATAIPPSSSNNIDNKVPNKAKRYKTGKTETAGLRKRLNTKAEAAPLLPNSSTKPGLLFLSNAKKVVRSDKDEGVSDEKHGQQSTLNRPGWAEPPEESWAHADWKVLNGTSTAIKSMSSLSTKVNERLQVFRTAEEREQSPEAIRLDGMKLKAFPYIVGEGPTLKLLSLQRNLISRLENTPSHLSLLVVLDLYENRIDRITGLQGMNSLKILLLGKNRIRRIEGLEELKRLEVLDLHGNQLRYVDNLGALFSLRVLNLAGNFLRSVRSLGGPSGLVNLTELNLKRNKIRNLEGLVKAPNLKKLLLANNELQSFASLLPLRKLSLLQELLLESNPIALTSDFRSQVLTMLPSVSILDRADITEGMRSAAKQWYKKKLAEEEERRKEEARLRTVSPTGGSENSREQAIYHARRRWESVKNFVKNSNSKPTNPSSPSLSGATENGTLPQIGNGPVRTGTDDLNSHFGSKSRTQTLSRGNSSQDSKSNLALIEGLGEARLNLAQLDTDLDQHQTILVSSGGNIKPMPLPEPEDSCPPSMINDLGPLLSPRDYVNTNSNGLALSTTTIQDGSGEKVGLGLLASNSQVEDQEIGVASQRRRQRSEVLLLSSQGKHNPQMDSSIIANIIKEEESAQSLQGSRQQKPPTSTPTLSSEGDADSSGLEKIGKPIGPFSKAEKGMRIAVVRPRLRETEVVPHASLELTDEIPLQVVLPDGESPNLGQTLNHGHESEAACRKEGDDAFPLKANSVAEQAALNNPQVETPWNDKDESALAFSSGDSGPSLNSSSCYDDKKTSEDSSNKKTTCPTFSPDASKQGTVKEENDAPTHVPATPSITKGVTDSTNSGEKKRVVLRKLRSASFDGRLPSTTASDNEPFESDIDDESVSSITTGSIATTAENSPRNRFGLFQKKSLFPRTKSQRRKIIRERSLRAQSSSNIPLTLRSKSGLTGSQSSQNLTLAPSSATGFRTTADLKSSRPLKRCDSAVMLGSFSNETTGSNTAQPIKKQGTDYLVEIDGKILSVYGQGALKHTLTGFPGNVTCSVTIAKFHYISYDSIIPFFAKLRQIYPSLEHLQFRANNICKLSQLNALADLQGLTSLHIAKEGNPLVSQDFSWLHYASYRLSHWGLQNVNGKEVSSEYRGGLSLGAGKRFEPLGFLALSCLPQTALTPLAKRLHMLHCFCCCSPSSSSDESGRGKYGKGGGNGRTSSPSPAEQSSSSSSNICTQWDDDPVLLDVIGKEALVYCPTTPQQVGDTQKIPANALSHTTPSSEQKASVLDNIIDCGVDALLKLDKLEKIWPSQLQEIVEQALVDFESMDTYVKRELKKCQDAATIALHKNKL